jgi:hypothetical protein
MPKLVIAKVPQFLCQTELELLLQDQINLDLFQLLHGERLPLISGDYKNVLGMISKM